MVYLETKAVSNSETSECLSQAIPIERKDKSKYLWLLEKRNWAFVHSPSNIKPRLQTYQRNELNWGEYTGKKKIEQKLNV